METLIILVSKHKERLPYFFQNATGNHDTSIYRWMTFGGR